MKSDLPNESLLILAQDKTSHIKRASHSHLPNPKPKPELPSVRPICPQLETVSDPGRNLPPVAAGRAPAALTAIRWCH